MIKKFIRQNKIVYSLISARSKLLDSKIIKHQVSLTTTLADQCQYFLKINSFNFSKQSQLMISQKYLMSTYKQQKNKSQGQNQSKKSDKSNEFKKKGPPLTIRPSSKQLQLKQKSQNHIFSFSITDPELYMEHINKKNTLSDAIKLMNRIVNTNNLSSQQFQQKVWKKYSYYVYLVGENQQKLWKGGNDSANNINSNTKSEEKSLNQHQQQKNQNQQTTHSKQNQKNLINQNNVKVLVGNHQKARQMKSHRMRIKYLDLITQIHQKFNGKLTSQNITKTFNKFADFYLDGTQWNNLELNERLILIQSITRYNVKKAKTIFLKKRGSLIHQLTKKSNQQTDNKEKQMSQNALRLLRQMTTLQVNDTQLVQISIQILYEGIKTMNLYQLQEITYLLGKSHKFVNKDFVLSIVSRFTNYFSNFHQHDTIAVLHIVSSLSMIQKNLRLTSIYFEPLDQVYEKIFPYLCSIKLSTYKSNYLASMASALRRSQFFDESILKGLIQECMKRDVKQFMEDQMGETNNSDQNKRNKMQDKNTISINNLIQLFFTLASFNNRSPQFMNYFINLLKLVQSQSNPDNSISDTQFSRLLWSMCVLCNQKQIQSLLPLMQHFYQKSRQVQFHQATNFYYCYLLLKRKYLLSEIRFQNDKVQQYLAGPKHQVQISQTQKQIHKHLLELGIPSLLEYNLNNVICDIYIPKFNGIEHLVIQVHGFHHFPRNVKRLNGSTILKQKIIQNQGYYCFYISLDQWLIAENKAQFVKRFMQEVITKKLLEKQKKKSLQASVQQVENLQKRGRRIIQFKKSKLQSPQLSQNQTEQVLKISDNTQIHTKQPSQ